MSVAAAYGKSFWKEGDKDKVVVQFTTDWLEKNDRRRCNKQTFVDVANKFNKKFNTDVTAEQVKDRWEKHQGRVHKKDSRQRLEKKKRKADSSDSDDEDEDSEDDSDDDDEDDDDEESDDGDLLKKADRTVNKALKIASQTIKSQEKVHKKQLGVIAGATAYAKELVKSASAKKKKKRRKLNDVEPIELTYAGETPCPNMSGGRPPSSVHGGGGGGTTTTPGGFSMGSPGGFSMGSPGGGLPARPNVAFGGGSPGMGSGGSIFVPPPGATTFAAPAPAAAVRNSAAWTGGGPGGFASGGLPPRPPSSSVGRGGGHVPPSSPAPGLAQGSIGSVPDVWSTPIKDPSKNNTRNAFNGSPFPDPEL